MAGPAARDIPISPEMDALTDEIVDALDALTRRTDTARWDALVEKHSDSMSQHNLMILTQSLVCGLTMLSREKCALQARVAALEQKPELKYCGVWQQSDVYGVGSLTTFKGSLWVAKKPSVSRRPGLDDSWQLCCRAGRDGRDTADLPTVKRLVAQVLSEHGQPSS